MTLRGLTFLDHTADVGFDVEAPTPEAAFHRAALGMLALLRGEEDADGPDGSDDAAGEDRLVERDLGLTAPDPARLLADWLRELLFLHEIDRLDYRSAAFETLDLPADPHLARLAAVVRLSPGGHAVREIKGVTYHEIDARRTPGGWAARVIFDV